MPKRYFKTHDGSICLSGIGYSLQGRLIASGKAFVPEQGMPYYPMKQPLKKGVAAGLSLSVAMCYYFFGCKEK